MEIDFWVAGSVIAPLIDEDGRTIQHAALCRLNFRSVDALYAHGVNQSAVADHAMRDERPWCGDF